MTIKCMNCGSTAQIRQEKIQFFENNAHVYYNCGCGTRFVRVYELVSEFKLAKKKIPNSIDNYDEV